MKRIFILSVLALGTALFIGCDSSSDSGTTLAWNNQAGEAVQEIVWNDSTGSSNQTWGGTTNDGSTTSAKAVTALTGTGECQDSAGDTAQITLSAGANIVQASSNSAQIAADTDAVLNITAVKKK